MSDLGEDDLSRLGEAIAVVNPDVLYYEAKRQFEALQRAQHGHDTPATPVRVTRQQSDLSLYYRSLYENVTTKLNELEKIQLLWICFAYKTKARVLQFLSYLDGDTHPWAGPIARVVIEHGTDSAFEQTGASANDEHSEGEEAEKVPGYEPLSASKTQSLVDQTAKELSSGLTTDQTAPTPLSSLQLPYVGSRSVQPISSTTTTSSLAKKRSYFIIPTLPIAFPAAFFTAYGSQAMVRHITVPHILCHPSAYLLALSPPLKSMLRENLPNFWKPNTSQGTSHTSEAEVAEEASWSAFFDYLLKGSEKLVRRNGEEVDIEGDGYTQTDLELWVAEWMADRQKKGNTEKGLKERARIRLSGNGARQKSASESQSKQTSPKAHKERSRGQSEDSEEAEESGDESTESDHDDERGQAQNHRRRRVNWNPLEMQISPESPSKKQKVTKDRKRIPGF